MFWNGRASRYFFAFVCSLIITICTASVVTAEDDGRSELDEGLVLLGIFIGEEEKDAGDILLENGIFYLPAESTFAALNVQVTVENGISTIQTPIGSIDLPQDALREFEDQSFISENVLGDTLHVPVRFDVENYAIVLEPPWGNGAVVAEEAEEIIEIEPDIVPPIIGMTSVHGDLFTTYSGTGDTIGVSTRLEVNGYGLGGVWQLGYSGTEKDYSLTDYAWLREITDNIWTLVGRQQSGAHPLISVVDMTGVQIAYSNRADAFEQIEDINGTLLDRGNGSGRVYFGEGPPGGRAELVIDGLIVAETIINVDGTFEIESPLFDQRRNDVEIRIFEALSNNQVDSIRSTVTANNFLAPKGSFNIVAGAGLEGGEISTNIDSRGPTGFARIRYSPYDDATVEAAVVYDPDGGIEAVTGAAASFGKYGTAYAAAALNQSGRKSFEGLYFAEFKKLSLNARINYREAEDLETGDTVAQENHFFEATYDYSQSLRFGAIARRNIDAAYALPFVSWRVYPGLSLAARPNRDGEYRLEARAEPFQDINLQVFYEGSGFARVGYDYYTEVTGESELSIEALYDQDTAELGFALGLNGQRFFGVPVFWQLRATHSSDNSSLSGGLRYELRPGVAALINGGFSQPASGNSSIFGTLGVTFDLGLAGRTLSAAPRQATNPRYGRIAGRVVAPEGVEFSAEDFKNAQVVVDGQPIGKVQANGAYWLPRIPKGTRSVRLEADNLPIDLVVDTDTIYAEVAPGAVTTVNFELAVEVGTSGRITGPDDEPVPGVPLQMLNSEGVIVSRARSNQFGLFRMDGLRPGKYVLKALDIWEGASTDVTIGSEYVFGSDLKVGKSGKKAKVVKTVTEL